MIQYLVVLLDDTSTSFCHYANPHTAHRLIPLETLRAGIIWAMKENLSVQFVYPSHSLPAEYEKVIDSVDHVKIKPAVCAEGAGVVVFDSIDSFTDYNGFTEGTAYVLRTDRKSLFENVQIVVSVLSKVERLNVVITDITAFTDKNFNVYAEALQTLANEVEKIYVSGKAVQLNLLTDRMMLKEMNNCGAGDTTLTLAPDGKFYVCPAFYNDADSYSIGSIEDGLDIKNPQLYRIDHAPICRNCDAFQCKRCIWLNRKTTLEVNTPSHEQCVIAHLERNASRRLLQKLRTYGTFLPEVDNIAEVDYLDPFDVRKEW